MDILLYIALPTEKFTVLLSHMRLAPIQIAFGDMIMCAECVLSQM